LCRIVYSAVADRQPLKIENDLIQSRQGLMTTQTPQALN
jgi:hypothetical protein